MHPRALSIPHSLSHNNFYQRPQTLMDPSDFRAFYPYTPNEVKHRKRTTSAQLKILESVFKRDTKPNAALRNELATQLDMTARGVQVWFQNRRAKEKNKAGKSSSLVRDTDEPRDPAGTETIILPQSTFPGDLPEFGDSSSQESSPSGTSPPQLHLNTAHSSWQSSPLDTPEDFRLSGDLDACLIRRGSLPGDGLYSDDSLAGHFDPFARRRSVDASLHRLAANPYANLARAKNSVLSGARYLPSNDFNASLHARHSSADSRAYRFSPPGLPGSPSPSPMSAYHSSIRSSLPDNQLMAFSTRPVSSPLPGPLPSPDYSFGIANTTLRSPDSERNSPDHGFMFRGEDLDTEDDAGSTSYDGYSRFGSIASIGTSESSNTSYYSEVGNCVDPTNGSENASHSQHRRNSSGHFAGLMSGLNVGGLQSQSPQQNQAPSITAAGASTVPVAPIPVSAGGLRLDLKDGDITSTYPSPSSTVSPGGSPNERNSSSTSSSLSLSSELIHALQSKPEVNHLSTYSPSQPLQHHNNPPARDSEVPFYLAENRYSPIALPTASIEFPGNEFHFASPQDNSDNFGAGNSGSDRYPVGIDGIGHDFASHHQNGSQDQGFTIYDSIDPSSTTSFM